MEIKVNVTAVNKKFILSKSPKLRKVGRQSLYFLIYLAQRKFRDGNITHNIPVQLKYNQTVIFKCSLFQWTKLRIAGIDTNIVITSYNKIIRNFFYEDFFEFMNSRFLKKELLGLQEQLIKEFAIDYMEKLSLSEDDIMLETLLRNYRRYRLNTKLDLYELIDSLDDCNINAPLLL